MGNSSSVVGSTQPATIAAGADVSTTTDSVTQSADASTTTTLPSHHLPNGTFTIPWEMYEVPSFSSFFTKGLREGLYGRMRSLEKTWRSMTEDELQQHLPMVRRTAQEWKELLVDGMATEKLLRATWVGHSTFLIQMGNRVILSDPVFSNRASMVQWMGPNRIRKPALTAQQLAETGISVNDVLISHNHYDHLDHAAVMDIHKHWPKATFFVPLKLKQWFLSCGIPDENVVELDWWQHASAGSGGGGDDDDDVKIHLVPVQHWTSRMGYDRNWTLWGGYIVERQSTGQKLFFSGDTGYCPVFKEIGQRFGTIDLALIPIGAYEPRSIMRSQHINPQEAVQIAMDIQAKRSVGMHWGTFILTVEDVTEPRELLREEVSKADKPEDWFMTLHHGATINVESDGSVNKLC